MSSRGVMTLRGGVMTPRDVTDRSSGVTLGHCLMLPRRPRCLLTSDCAPSLRRSSEFQITAAAADVDELDAVHELLDVICVICESLISLNSGFTSSWAIISSCMHRLPSLFGVVIFLSTLSTTSTSGSADCGLLTSWSPGWHSLYKTPFWFLSSRSVSSLARSDLRHRARRFWNQTCAYHSLSLKLYSCRHA